MLGKIARTALYAVMYFVLAWVAMFLALYVFVFLNAQLLAQPCRDPSTGDSLGILASINIYFVMALVVLAIFKGHRNAIIFCSIALALVGVAWATTGVCNMLGLLTAGFSMTPAAWIGGVAIHRLWADGGPAEHRR